VRIILNRSDTGHFGKMIYRKTTTSSSKRAFVWRRGPFRFWWTDLVFCGRTHQLAKCHSSWKADRYSLVHLGIISGISFHRKAFWSCTEHCCILHNILNEHNSAINETWQQAANDLSEQPNRTNMSADFSQPAEKIWAEISQYCLNGNK